MSYQIVQEGQGIRGNLVLVAREEVTAIGQGDKVGIGDVISRVPAVGKVDQVVVAEVKDKRWRRDLCQTGAGRPFRRRRLTNAYHPPHASGPASFSSTWHRSPVVIPSSIATVNSANERVIPPFTKISTPASR